MTLTEIRAALETRGLRPLKQLGQNFLHDQNLAKWLASQAVEGAQPGATVVEIGPGLGALTSFLIEQKFKVIALEKDRGLCVFLRERFANEIAEGTFELREGDALDLLPQLGVTPEVICGNLPYYISTPLLMECLKLTGSPSRLFFLMQKEVGLRLVSHCGNKTYGSLSVQVQTAWDVKLVRNLPGSVFYPPPEIESVSVLLTPKVHALISNGERERFSAFVQKGFSQRRKKLSNLLPTDDSRRAEHLSPKDWADLWQVCEKTSS